MKVWNRQVIVYLCGMILGLKLFAVLGLRVFSLVFLNSAIIEKDFVKISCKVVEMRCGCGFGGFGQNQLVDGLV